MQVSACICLPEHLASLSRVRQSENVDTRCQRGFNTPVCGRGAKTRNHTLTNPRIASLDNNQNATHSRKVQNAAWRHKLQIRPYLLINPAAYTGRKATFLPAFNSPDSLSPSGFTVFFFFWRRKKKKAEWKLQSGCSTICSVPLVDFQGVLISKQFQS